MWSFSFRICNTNKKWIKIKICYDSRFGLYNLPCSSLDHKCHKQVFMSDIMFLFTDRDPGEKEFHQAVKEVVESVWPVLGPNPHYCQAAILERITEPEPLSCSGCHGWTTRKRFGSNGDSGLKWTAPSDFIRAACVFIPRSTWASSNFWPLNRSLKMPWRHFHQGRGCSKKDTQISGIVGSKGKAASKNQRQYPIRRLCKIREADL